VALLEADISAFGKVGSEIENVCEALNDVSKGAEGAQTKSAPTKAQFGRVARLEAEVSALRTTIVAEVRSEVENLRN
jgi:hypothetical protein